MHLSRNSINDLAIKLLKVEHCQSFYKEKQ